MKWMMQVLWFTFSWIDNHKTLFHTKSLLTLSKRKSWKKTLLLAVMEVKFYSKLLKIKMENFIEDSCPLTWQMKFLTRGQAISKQWFSQKITSLLTITRMLKNLNY